MQWRDIGEFNPEEHGTDALLLKMQGYGARDMVVYGWYDPEASETYPWRFIDDHGGVNGEWDVVAVNGAQPLGTVKAFIPFYAIPQ